MILYVSYSQRIFVYLHVLRMYTCTMHTSHRTLHACHCAVHACHNIVLGALCEKHSQNLQEIQHLQVVQEAQHDPAMELIITYRIYNVCI